MKNLQGIAKISLILIRNEMWHTVRLYTGTYHPVQKVSDLRPGKESYVPGGAQFLIPFKVGPL
jgi:hypothetical protein